MARMYKCGMCGKDVLDEEAEIINKRRYCIHNGCANEKRLNERENIAYKELIDYCLAKFNTKEVNPTWMSQIKYYKEKNDMKYRGILLTLEYYYDSMDKDVGETNTFLGIVPYNYTKAKEAYIVEMERQKTFNEFVENGKELMKHEKVVVIRHKVENELRNRRMVDMSQFEDLED